MAETKNALTEAGRAFACEPEGRSRADVYSDAPSCVAMKAAVRSVRAL
jgi:hypothetical protein